MIDELFEPLINDDTSNDALSSIDDKLPTDEDMQKKIMSLSSKKATMLI
jgi:hypothetical protein